MERFMVACGPTRARSNSRRAFTLLELLIVLAVLVLLIAILVPSLRAARSQTKRAVCASNLGQIARGWHLYLDEFNGRFLKGVDVNWNYGGKQGNGSAAFGSVPKNSQQPWDCADKFDPTKCTPQIRKPLNRFLGLDEVVFDRADVFHCPADKGGGDVPTNHYDYKGTSYITNLMLVGQTQLSLRLFDPCRKAIKDLNRTLKDLRRHQLYNESKLVLIGDGGWVNAWDIGAFRRIDWHDRPRTHNVAFMDGHVEFLEIRKGLHVTSDYSVVPFKDLVDDFQACQKEVEGE